MNVCLNVEGHDIIVDGGKQYTKSVNLSISANGWSSGDISLGFTLPKGLYISRVSGEPQTSQSSKYYRLDSIGASYMVPVDWIRCFGAGVFIATEDKTTIPWSVWTNAGTAFTLATTLEFTKIF